MQVAILVYKETEVSQPYPDDDTGHRISAFQSYFARPVRPVITREAGERMARQVALIRQADEEWREERAILRQCGINGEVS